ncbi:hypothetical protein Y030_738 [Burkholderia pseudomallei MSHR332]|nr:hypothetical protein Y030_738 [Burkholderia pseudomallei MSHR332]
MNRRHFLAAAVAAGLPLAATLAPRGARAQPNATQAAAPTLARQLAEYAAGCATRISTRRRSTSSNRI